jgi:formylglycine-generating enzyme required for sulfatase activity
MSMVRHPRIITGVVVAGSMLLLAGASLAHREHLLFWWRFERLGANAQGYGEYRHRRTGIVFVKLPGGRFWMGAQKEDPAGRNYDPEAEENESPVHAVELSPLLIAKREVTQAQWRAVMGENPSWFQPGGSGGGDIPPGVSAEDLPVEQVSWDECQEFCRKTGLRLPTEAEWEYACRAGEEGPYGAAGDLGEMAWYDENSGGRTHPVGTKRPNGFGLHDLHGSVWEWCEDLYDREFYSRPEAGWRDPLCTSGSGSRVNRGGCCWIGARLCRSAFRLWFRPGYRFLNLGFRPAGPSPLP